MMFHIKLILKTTDEWITSYKTSYLGEKVIIEFLLITKHCFHWKQNIIFKKKFVLWT